MKPAEGVHEAYTEIPNTVHNPEGKVAAEVEDIPRSIPIPSFQSTHNPISSSESISRSESSNIYLSNRPHNPTSGYKSHSGDECNQCDKALLAWRARYRQPNHSRRGDPEMRRDFDSDGSTEPKQHMKQVSNV